jgi:hypothetical protein
MIRVRITDGGAEQLPQITILWTGYPDARKAIFREQFQQQSGILAVGLLLAHALGFDLRGIADPDLDSQFYE